MSNKLYKQIEKIIPYIDENFITFPLWEEGLYIPFVKFWQIFNDEIENDKAVAIVEKFNIDNKKYDIEFDFGYFWNIAII